MRPILWEIEGKHIKLRLNTRRSQDNAYMGSEIRVFPDAIGKGDAGRGKRDQENVSYSPIAIIAIIPALLHYSHVSIACL